MIVNIACPKTTVQLCIVHMVRASLNYVNWQERKPVAHDLKSIYRAATVEEAERQLAEFAAIKTRGAFPSEDAALKVMYLALRNLAKKWHTVQGWKEALNRFALLWENRFPEQCA